MEGYHHQPLTSIEALLMLFLPSQYHWMILLSREAADNLWYWLPILVALYAVYQFVAYQASRRIATPHIEGNNMILR